MQQSSRLSSLKCTGLAWMVRGYQYIDTFGLLALGPVAILLLPGIIYASPVEAIEAATEEAVEHAGTSHAVSWIWCLRVIFAAAIGTIIYHCLTFMLAIYRKRAQNVPSGTHCLPSGSIWKSNDHKIRLSIDNIKTGNGILTHSQLTERGEQAESWSIVGLKQVTSNATNDLIGYMISQEHGGYSGTVIIHRGGYNDLRTIIWFSDTTLEPIEIELKRIRRGVCF